MGLPLASIGADAASNSSTIIAIQGVPDKTFMTPDCMHQVRASLIGSTSESVNFPSHEHLGWSTESLSRAAEQAVDRVATYHGLVCDTSNIGSISTYVLGTFPFLSENQKHFKVQVTIEARSTAEASEGGGGGATV